MLEGWTKVGSVACGAPVDPRSQTFSCLPASKDGSGISAVVKIYFENTSGALISSQTKPELSVL